MEDHANDPVARNLGGLQKLYGTITSMHLIDMRWFIIFLISVLLAAVCSYIFYKKQQALTSVIQPKKPDSFFSSKEAFRLKSTTAGIKKFVQQNNYNSSFCFLIDMAIQSGRKRFFVYDINKDSVLLKGLVTHGVGKSNGDTIELSNITVVIALPSVNIKSVNLIMENLGLLTNYMVLIKPIAMLLTGLWYCTHMNVYPIMR